MAEFKIANGTRVSMAYDVSDGHQPEFSLKCTFKKALDESAFLLSVPMQGGKALKLDDTQKFLICYEQGGEQFFMAAYADDEVKEGLHRYWRMRRVGEQRAFYQRKDERFKVALQVKYLLPTWPLNSAGKIEKEEGMSLDISAGGLAFFLNWAFDVGQMIEVFLPRFGSSDSGVNSVKLTGVVCWCREAPKGSVYRRICGIQFQFADEEEKQKLDEYVTYVKKRCKA